MITPQKANLKKFSFTTLKMKKDFYNFTSYCLYIDLDESKTTADYGLHIDLEERLLHIIDNIDSDERHTLVPM